MSILSRLGKIVHGIGGVIEAPVELGWDLARANWVDDPDLDGFFHVLVGRTTNRGAQWLGSMFGPEGGIGSTIGALPEPVRNPVGEVVHPILDGGRWVYTNGISHPMATFLVVGAMTQSQEWKDAGHSSSWSTYVDPDAWSEAYKITKHMSPGQALAVDLNFGFGHDVLGWKNDVMDQGERNKFAGTDFYKGVSGITDAVLSWQYDPLARAGHLGSAAKLAYIDRPLRAGMLEGERVAQGALKAGATAEEAAVLGRAAAGEAHSAQISQYMRSNRWYDLEGHLADIYDRYGDIDTRAGAIKAELFPTHAQGHDMGAIFARTGSFEERSTAMRVMMGENNATRLLVESNPELAESMREGFEQSSMVQSTLFTPEYHNSPTYRPDVNPGAQIDAAKIAFDADARLSR